jgi:hypothetical protein
MAPAAPKPKPPAKTKKVTIPNVASDPTYLRAVANYNRIYNDTHAGIALQDSQYNAQFGQNMSQLGWDPVTKRWKTQDPTNQITQARTDNMDDYAARGMGASGAYNDDLNTVNRTFNQRRDQSILNRDQQHEALTQQSTVARNARSSGISDARVQAAQAIAGKYGVDTGVVPTNPKAPKKKTVTIPVAG